MAAYASLLSLAQPIDQILILLQSFLEEFPEKASRFEGRIRSIANEAEDIIERLMLERSWLIEPSEIKFRDPHLKKVTKELESIAGEIMKVKNMITMKDLHLGEFSATASSSWRPGKHEVVGLEDDLLAIKERLCGGSSKLQVITIIGMGGIGKTTLASNAYEDPLTVHYFDIRIWVTVSQDYSGNVILSRILLLRQPTRIDRSGMRRWKNKCTKT